MVSPGTVASDAAQIETLFNKYQECLNAMKNDSIWQGSSRDNAHSKGEEFVNEFRSPINEQMSNLASAISKFMEYKTVKAEYEQAKASYNSAIASDDSEVAASYTNIMREKKERMEALKAEINALLASVCGVKLTSTNNITGEASPTISLGLTGGTSAILNSAKSIHKYMEDNHYTYCVYGCNNNEECTDGNHKLNINFEDSKSSGNHKTCCATYVTWVLQDAGYLGKNEGSHGADELKRILVGKGWQELKASNTELQPGDVIYRSNHVQIYGEDGKIYNAGSGKSIRNISSSSSGNLYDTDTVLRAPDNQNKGV